MTLTQTIPALPPWDMPSDGVEKTDFGTREFATVDQDNNLVTFFQRTA